MDALVNLTGFSLVGGPASQDAKKAKEVLMKLNRPYMAARNSVGSSFQLLKRHFSGCESGFQVDVRVFWASNDDVSWNLVVSEVSVPLVFQSFTEWQNSQLGLHPVQARDSRLAVALHMKSFEILWIPMGFSRRIHRRKPPTSRFQVALQVSLPEIDGAIEPLIFSGRDGTSGRSIPMQVA